MKSDFLLSLGECVALKVTHSPKDVKKSSFMVLYRGKNSFNYHKTPPVKRVHFDVEFLFFDN